MADFQIILLVGGGRVPLAPGCSINNGLPFSASPWRSGRGGVLGQPRQLQEGERAVHHTLGGEIYILLEVATDVQGGSHPHHCTTSLAATEACTTSRLAACWNRSWPGHDSQEQHPTVAVEAQPAAMGPTDPRAHTVTVAHDFCVRVQEVRGQVMRGRWARHQRQVGQWLGQDPYIIQ